jgi:hypothetical protein
MTNENDMIDKMRALEQKLAIGTCNEHNLPIHNGRCWRDLEMERDRLVKEVAVLSRANLDKYGTTEATELIQARAELDVASAAALMYRGEWDKQKRRAEAAEKEVSGYNTEAQHYAEEIAELHQEREKFRVMLLRHHVAKTTEEWGTECPTCKEYEAEAALKEAEKQTPATFTVQQETQRYRVDGDYATKLCKHNVTEWNCRICLAGF